jgi:hypothetical protein
MGSGGLSPSAIHRLCALHRHAHLLPSPVPCVSRFVALHSYSAHGPDELDLQKGEGIKVLGKYQDGWLRGISLVTGRVGIFPSNYVIPIFRYVPTNLRHWMRGWVILGKGPSVGWTDGGLLATQSIDQEIAFALVSP